MRSLGLVLLLLAGAQSQIDSGIELLATDFSSSTGGWEQLMLVRDGRTLVYRPTATALQHVCEGHGSRMACGIQGEDSGGSESADNALGHTVSATAGITIQPLNSSHVPVEEEVWYFSSPPSWSVDLASAYGGAITIRLEHAVVPAAGRVYEAADIVLTSQCGHALSFSLPLLPRTRPPLLSAPLLAGPEAGWLDSRTKQPPTEKAFLGTLAHLRDVKIRGGVYYGFEVAALRSVVISQGFALRPCCHADADVEICPGPRAKPHLNPPGLRFPCEGDVHRRARVDHVTPRVTSRAGGARITVIGRNFGVDGSRPRVFIAGKPCASSEFWERPAHCENGQADTELGETGVDTGGACYSELCFNGLTDAVTWEEGPDCGGLCRACLGRELVRPLQRSVVVCVAPRFEETDLLPYQVTGAGGEVTWEGLVVTLEVEGAPVPVTSQYHGDTSRQITCITDASRDFRIGGYTAGWARQIWSENAQAEVADVDIDGADGSVYVGGSAGAGAASGRVEARREKEAWMPAAGGFVGKLGGGEGGGVEWVCGVHGAVGGSVSVHSVSVAQGARAHVTSSSTAGPATSSSSSTLAPTTSSSIPPATATTTSMTGTSASTSTTSAVQTTSSSSTTSTPPPTSTTTPVPTTTPAPIFSSTGAVYATGIASAGQYNVTCRYKGGAENSTSVALDCGDATVPQCGFAMLLSPDGVLYWFLAPVGGLRGGPVGLATVGRMHVISYESSHSAVVAAHGDDDHDGVVQGAYLVGELSVAAYGAGYLQFGGGAGAVNVTVAQGTNASLIVAARVDHTGRMLWVRLIVGTGSAVLQVAKPTVGVSRTSGGDRWLYIAGSIPTGIATTWVQGCTYGASPYPPTTAAVPPTPPPLIVPEKELILPPHLECYRGGGRGFVLRPSTALRITAIRWPQDALCSYDDNGEKVLRLVLALVGDDVLAPGEGVEWSTVNYTVIANVETTRVDQWFDLDLVIPPNRTVAVWGDLGGTVSYAGSASANTGPFDAGIGGGALLFRLVGPSWDARKGAISLERGPSFGRWEVRYQEGVVPATAHRDAPPTAPTTTTTTTTTTTPTPAAREEGQEAGAVCSGGLRGMEEEGGGHVCDDGTTGGCRLGAPAGNKTVFLTAFNGRGQPEWVLFADGGEVEPVAVGHVERGLAWRGLNSAQRVGEGLNSVVLVAEVRGNGLADFGRTLEPLACSTGKRVGEKGLGNRVHDASSPCSGTVRGQGSTGKGDVLVVKVGASSGEVTWVRRTGLTEGQERPEGVAVDERGDILVVGSFSAESEGREQGNEAEGGGSDVFSLVAGRRPRSVGCDIERVAGASESEGLPWCGLYAHARGAAGTEPRSGFVMKMHGDASLASRVQHSGARSNLGLLGSVARQPSGAVLLLTPHLPPIPAAYNAENNGYEGLLLEVVGGAGVGYIGKVAAYNASAHAVTLVPPPPALGPSSLLRIGLRSSGRCGGRGSSYHSVHLTALFAGTDQLYVGLRLHIRRGPAAGYSGIILQYDAATQTVTSLDPPTLPAIPTYDSVFELEAAAPHSSRNHLSSCHLPNDVACGADGVLWARTVAYSRPDPSSGPSSQPRSVPSSVAVADGKMVVAGELQGFATSFFAVPAVDEVGVHASDAEQGAYVVAFEGL